MYDIYIINTRITFYTFSGKLPTVFLIRKRPSFLMCDFFEYYPKVNVLPVCTHFERIFLLVLLILIL